MAEDQNLVKQFVETLKKAEVNKNAGKLEPIDPDHVLHKGHWESDRWGRLGTIEASSLSLRDDVTEEYDGHVTVTAKKWGTEVRIVFDNLKITPDFHNRSGKYPPFIKENVLKQGNTITFQVTDIVDSAEKDYIVSGTYRSVDPNDHGKFEFSPTTDTMMDKRPSHSRCSLM